MDEATQSYYEDMIDMFATEGWSRLVAEFVQTESELDTLDKVANTEQLYFTKGQLAVVNDIISLEERVRAALDDLENPQEFDDAAYL